MTTYPVTDSMKNILKNFSVISSSLLLKTGKIQKTMSPAKSILAIAEFEQDWPMDTPVYQLPELLANISSYDKPELGFEKTQFVITGTGGFSHVEFPYSDPSVINTPPEKSFPLDNPNAEFILSADAVKEIKKFSAIKSLPTIQIAYDADDQTVVVKPYDDKNPASRTYSYPVHKSKDAFTVSKTGQFKLKREHFELIMDGSYTVTLGPWPYSYFKHNSEPVSYYIVQKS